MIPFLLLVFAMTNCLYEFRERSIEDENGACVDPLIL
jgi:hypothetical protein